MRYLLDTNIISFALRDQHGVKTALMRHATADMLLSSIVLAEGRVGAYRSSDPERWCRRWDLLTEGWNEAPFDAVAADCYGRIRAELERRGSMIGHRDCQIAATALAHHDSTGQTVTLVTDNEHEFRRVPGLRVENWIKRSRL